MRSSCRRPPNHDAPRWRLLCDGREFPLKPGDNVLGRTGEGITALDAPSVSRQHARLTIADGQAVIEDLLVTIHALLGAVTTETVERPQ